MFDLNDQNLIKTLIKGRKIGAYVKPVYVKNYTETYGLNQLKEIGSKYNQSACKIGFGVHISILDKFSFPKSLINTFDPNVAFTTFDDEKQISERFIIYETMHVDESILNNHPGNSYDVKTSDLMGMKEDDKLNLNDYKTDQTKSDTSSDIERKVIQQMMYYQDMIYKFLFEQRESIRKQIVQSELAYNGGVTSSSQSSSE